MGMRRGNRRKTKPWCHHDTMCTSIYVLCPSARCSSRSNSGAAHLTGLTAEVRIGPPAPDAPLQWPPHRTACSAASTTMPPTPACAGRSCSHQFLGDTSTTGELQKSITSSPAVTAVHVIDRGCGARGWTRQRWPYPSAHLVNSGRLYLAGLRHSGGAAWRRAVIPLTARAAAASDSVHPGLGKCVSESPQLSNKP